MLYRKLNEVVGWIVKLKVKFLVYGIVRNIFFFINKKRFIVVRGKIIFLDYVNKEVFFGLNIL